MKYDKEHRDIIINALADGQGRVRACKAAGISYETFTVWLGKPEFSEDIKKAEGVGENKIKDLARRGIIEKFQEHWQAAAWWLERKYPDEYKNRQELVNKPERINLEKLTDEELQQLASIEQKLISGNGS